jgi:HPt (histidine-containing phosphotransfer) domain-containing protein
MLGGAIGHGLTREFILSEFMRLHRDDLAQLRSHLAAGDTDSARKQVHTLEGAAAMVGARSLRTALAGLGAALRAGREKAAVDAALAACEAEISVFLKKWERRASVKADSAEAFTVS